MRGFTGYLIAGAALATGAALALGPSHLHAQADAALSVARGEGAEDCPDAAMLAASIHALRGADPSGPIRYAVLFARTGGVYSTRIQSGVEGHEVRQIEDRGPDCAALAQATAVTLALLYDADAAHTPSSEPAPVARSVAAPPAPAAAPPATRATQSAAPTLQASLSLGGGALIGVVRPVAPLLLGEVGAVLPHLRFALGALFVPAQRIELAPGHVTAYLLSGDARACYAALRRASLRLELCSGFALGATRAAAHGFTRDERRTRLFYAWPVEVAFAQLGRAVGWELGAALLIPFRRAQFSVDGAGTAYESPPLAALLTLRAIGLWPW
jgi:hypothetical protein